MSQATQTKRSNPQPFKVRGSATKGQANQILRQESTEIRLLKQLLNSRGGGRGRPAARSGAYNSVHRGQGARPQGKPRVPAVLAGPRSVESAVVSIPRAENEIAEIVQAICDPDPKRRIRFADPYSDAPVAVATPSRTFSEDWKLATGDELYYAATRLPSVADFVLFPNPGHVEYKYYGYGKDNSTATNSVPITNWSVQVLPNEPQWLQIPYWKPFDSDVFKPHMDYQLAGAVDGNNGRYVWIENLEQTSVIVRNATITSANVTITWVRWDKGDYNYVNTLTAPIPASAAHTFELPIDGRGYYALTLESNVAGDYGIEGCYHSGSDAITGHQCMQDFCENVNSIKGIRMLGTAVTYTNDASTLNNQGKVVANQIPEGEMWYDWTSYDAMATTVGRWDDNVKKGVNGFLKCTQATDMDLQSYTKIKGKVLDDSFWPIDHMPAFLMFVIKITDQDGRDGHFKHRWLTNYTTTDTFREIDVAPYSAATFRLAVESIKGAPQFSENPSHGKQILNFARKAAKGIVKYGPMAMTFASMVV